MKINLRWRLCVTMVLISVLGGCASVDKTMRSWLGSSQAELIAAWGPPQQVLDDGQGGRIFIYSRNRTFTTPGQATTNTYGSAMVNGNSLHGSATSTTTYMPPQTSGYAASRTFFLDASGRIYQYAWKGL